MKNKSGSRIRRFTNMKINLSKFICGFNQNFNGNILWIFCRKIPAVYKMYMEGQRARKRRGNPEEGEVEEGGRGLALPDGKNGL